MGTKKLVGDKFGHVQDRIVDLVFDDWNEARILELRGLLMSVETKERDADKAALVQRVVVTVQVLADLNDDLALETNPERAAKTMARLTDKHQRLLELMQSWFRF